MQNCARRPASNGAEDWTFRRITSRMHKWNTTARSTLLSIAVAIAGEPVHPFKPSDQNHCDRDLSDAQIFESLSA
jgi:hypothetical protein